MSEAPKWGRLYRPRHAKHPPKHRNLFDMARWQCEKCGRKDSLTRDHVVPLSMGGRDTNYNKQILCKHCNEEKGNDIAVYTKRKKVRAYARSCGWVGD